MKGYLWVYALFWLAVLGTIIATAVRMHRLRKRKRDLELHETPFLSSADADVLNEQLLEGDISLEEYEARKQDIQRRKA